MSEFVSLMREIDFKHGHELTALRNFISGYFIQRDRISGTSLKSVSEDEKRRCLHSFCGDSIATPSAEVSINIIVSESRALDADGEPSFRSLQVVERAFFKRLGAERRQVIPLSEEEYDSWARALLGEPLSRYAYKYASRRPKDDRAFYYPIFFDYDGSPMTAPDGLDWRDVAIGGVPYPGWIGRLV